MQQKMKLAVVGAGPKALAIAAKASVLKRLGVDVPEIHLFEKNEVGAHWAGQFGYTSGNLPLGTPPEKDLGFPYHSQFDSPSLSQDVNTLMHEFSWQSFLVGHGTYSDWIDRGKPAPMHKDWSRYLKWVFEKIAHEVFFYKATVSEVDIEGERWCIQYGDQSMLADGIVLTGPGETVLPSELLNSKVHSAETFWKQRKSFHFKSDDKILVVGGGETAAAIVACLSSCTENPECHVMTSKGYVYSRGESYLENRVYSDPSHANWADLTVQDRLEFMARTDRGVFSQDMQHQINRSPALKIIPGHWTGSRLLDNGRVAVDYSYNDRTHHGEFDYLIVATAGDSLKFSKKLLSNKAQEKLSETLGSSFHDGSMWQMKMDENLSLQGAVPYFHLPSVAGLSQGPGFSNLSCLGALADRVLGKYITFGEYSGN